MNSGRHGDARCTSWRRRMARRHARPRSARRRSRRSSRRARLGAGAADRRRRRRDHADGELRLASRHHVSASCPGGSRLVGGGGYLRNAADPAVLPTNGLVLGGTTASSGASPVDLAAPDGAVDPMTWMSIANFTGVSEAGDQASSFALCATSGGPSHTVVKVASRTGANTAQEVSLRTRRHRVLDLLRDLHRDRLRRRHPRVGVLHRGDRGHVTLDRAIRRRRQQRACRRTARPPKPSPSRRPRPCYRSRARRAR